MRYLTLLELYLTHCKFQKNSSDIIKGGQEVCIFLKENRLFGNLPEYGFPEICTVILGDHVINNLKQKCCLKNK